MAKTYTAAGTVVAGEVYTAAAHNIIVTDVNNFIVPPMCKMTLTTARSITSTVHTSVSFNTDMREDYDTDGMLATSPGSFITVQTAGVYYCAASVVYATNAVGTRYGRIFRKRSGTEVAFSSVEYLAPASGASGLSLAGSIECNVGDTLELGVLQTSGGALNISAEGQFQTTTLSVLWVGRTT